MAAGTSPLRLMLGGRVRIRGKRRRALKLRAMANGDDVSIADAAAAGAEIDPDAIFRALEYLIEPEWTRGHRFTLAYEIAPGAKGTGAGTWYVRVNDGHRLQVGTDPPAGGAADPALAPAGGRRAPGELMGYGELYALWERQNWRVHELDFSIDREQWVTTPREAQENTAWSLGSFYIGEERVTADLAPFLLAAPSGEVEVFLATQLVDEARHAAFFDRFSAEVMALESDDLRTRMRELEAMMMPPWFETFDDGLRDVANRIKASPDDLDLFVEGITTYHLIIEGVLATTGQRMILKYTEDHGLYPGFQKGFSLVEQDEHRHIAFGVRFLRDAGQPDPARHGGTIQRTVEELVPRAAHVFVPEYADSPREFVSYGYHSSFIYGYAYRKLKRRMGVLGLDCPPPEELMPGPIASVEEARAAAMPV